MATNLSNLNKPSLPEANNRRLSNARNNSLSKTPGSKLPSLNSPHRSVSLNKLSHSFNGPRKNPEPVRKVSLRNNSKDSLGSHVNHRKDVSPATRNKASNQPNH
ncbi:hypothetical protein GCM10023183_01270 [Nibribacter koreensis]|uniref:Uncharacterized protein n=1 Tax=Nibribacter koreensis TaxID=1084519 RepID=A0ABP8F5A3_9BACT